MSQIEGDMPQNSSVLLVEDLTTDGGSKITFVEALREAGGMVTDVFVIFYYNTFPGAEANMAKTGVRMHYLCDWQDVIEVAESGRYFTPKQIDDVKEFLDDPLGWSATHGGK
ncbi:MAG: orotate phosphoribosyltransferase, partial [Pseudomonadota bacterium]|nr:orotate phosphoribosyltransferase [Pseudomonadota bacterium]